MPERIGFSPQGESIIKKMNPNRLRGQIPLKLSSQTSQAEQFGGKDDYFSQIPLTELRSRLKKNIRELESLRSSINAMIDDGQRENLTNRYRALEQQSLVIQEAIEKKEAEEAQS